MPLLHRMLCFAAKCCAALLAVATSATGLAAPVGYPIGYGDLEAQANRERALTIWSVTDAASVAPLLDRFRKHYPGIMVKYIDLPARILYTRFLVDADAGRGTADFLWSSAMDLQIKLVNDGYSQSYMSPERANMPDWAAWKNEAWGITAEPIVFAYNRRQMAQFGTVPGTHPDLLRFLRDNRSRIQGRIASYDPAVSAVGYLYLAEDKQANRNTWDMVSAMGRAGVRLYPTTEAILAELATGRLAFAYGMIGSYALEAQARHPDIGVIVPRDYDLIMSRIAMIPKGARHPAAAKLFLDFLLSREGQALLASRYLTPVRTDIALPPNLRIATDSARAIRVGPSLLVHQDQLTRAKFLRDWARALAGK